MVTERFASRAWAVAALAAAVAIGAPVLVTPALAAPAAPVPPAGPIVPAVPAPPTAPTTPPSITLDRSTGLLRGQLVNITATGFPFGAATVVECNNTPGQPTVSISGFDVPVGCTQPFGQSPFTPGPYGTFPPGSPSGSLHTTFIVQTGIVGPPILTIDSARNNSAADAANYPCPPTAAQQAAGASCAIIAGAAIYGPSSPSVANQPPTAISASVPITFGTPVATHPSISASPSTGLSSGQVVYVTGTGFTPDSPGQVVECNLTPGEPTNGNGSYPLPVGCTSLSPVISNARGIGFSTGAVPPVAAASPITASRPPGATSAKTAAVRAAATPTTVIVPSSPAPPPPGKSVVGYAPAPGQPSPAPGSFLTTASGTFSTTVAIREGDIAGGNTAAAAYPCPPTPANLAAGGSCALVALDAAGEQASQAIIITGPVPRPTIAILPAAGLTAGTRVRVVGSGFIPQSPGGVVECNATPGQPTISISGRAAPVGCTNPFMNSLTYPSPTGTVSTRFDIRTGVIGPIQAGTDSAGHDAAADAAAYPCPPTPAQQRAGNVCTIVVGDLGGDAVAGPISFAGAQPSPAGGPVVGLAAHAASGYWLVAADGAVFTFGDAGFFGSLPGMGVHPGAPITGIAASPSGHGYWLVASDGAVFSFGDAVYHGSLPGLHLRPNLPITGMAPTPDGRGYWLTAADGAIFSFGDATFLGSYPGNPFRLPIPSPTAVIGIAATATGNGYWLALGGGVGVLSFGDANDYFGQPGGRCC